jgi:hypothetical protein
MLTWIDWFIILGYFGVLAGVVVFSLRRNKIESGEDLFLGGRSVGWLAIGASIFAAIPGFAKFYRHVLIQKRFPHHGAYGFDHAGKALFEALRLLGVDDINTPKPAGELYPGENPFAV